jgi:hypothetical protein
MNHTITNAVVFIPEGTATINYSESGPSFLTQNISCAASAPIPVSKVYVRDKYGSAINTVKVNGAPVTYSRVGSGFAKELCLNWSGAIGTEGVRIVVSDEVVNTSSVTSKKTQVPSSRTMLFAGRTSGFYGKLLGADGRISIYDPSGHLLKTYASFKDLPNRRKYATATNSVFIVKFEPLAR